MNPEQFKATMRSLEPDEIRAYINIALEVLIELAALSRMTLEEQRAWRKQTLGEEIDIIDAELVEGGE